MVCATPKKGCGISSSLPRGDPRRNLTVDFPLLVSLDLRPADFRRKYQPDTARKSDRIHRRISEVDSRERNIARRRRRRGPREGNPTSSARAINATLPDQDEDVSLRVPDTLDEFFGELIPRSVDRKSAPLCERDARGAKEGCAQYVYVAGSIRELVRV